MRSPSGIELSRSGVDPFWYVVVRQPRSQGLSLARPRGGKMRDPGNEVE